MNNWKSFIEQEQQKEYYKKLLSLIEEDSKKNIIYPHKNDIFNAFKLCDLKDIKCVILGQDAYINDQIINNKTIPQAMGLSFSVRKDFQLPPSLKNIFKELKNDLNISNISGDLTVWARQGVLLLNSALTVRKGESNSHANFGWHIFTDEAIKLINEQDRPIVYLLWGSFARSKKKFITNSKHLILESAHPSPLSAHNGFIGNKHFSKCNDFLIKNNIVPIDWKT